MAKVVLRQKAIDDLNHIWGYTFEKWSAKQADKYYAAIKLACDGIGQNPDIGKQYNRISQKLLGGLALFDYGDGVDFRLGKFIFNFLFFGAAMGWMLSHPKKEN